MNENTDLVSRLARLETDVAMLKQDAVTKDELARIVEMMKMVGVGPKGDEHDENDDGEGDEEEGDPARALSISLASHTKILVRRPSTMRI